MGVRAIGLSAWAHSTVSPYRESYYADAYHCVYHAKYVEQTRVLLLIYLKDAHAYVVLACEEYPAYLPCLT